MLSPMMWLGLVALGVLAVASIRRIPEGQVYTLRRLGGQTRVMHSGMHFMLPLLERVAHKISLTGSNVPVDGLVAEDRQYRGIVYFHVLDPARAEVKHLYLRDRARGRGWGRELLAELEARAVGLGARVVVLDTNATLEAAQGLYRSSGYLEVEPYNDNPNATHWFSKDLDVVD